MHVQSILSYALVAITTVSAAIPAGGQGVAKREPFNAGKIGVIVAAVEARQAQASGGAAPSGVAPKASKSPKASKGVKGTGTPAKATNGAPVPPAPSGAAAPSGLAPAKGNGKASKSAAAPPKASV